MKDELNALTNLMTVMNKMLFEILRAQRLILEQNNYIKRQAEHIKKQDTYIKNMESQLGARSGIPDWKVTHNVRQ